MLKLKSDYLGMTEYYYNPTTNQIVCLEKGKPSPVSYEVDKHLRTLNAISQPVTDWISFCKNHKFQ
jgi:hypothetical protein